MIDEKTDFDDEYERAINLKRTVGSVNPINDVHSKRPTAVTKKNPENENPVKYNGYDTSPWQFYTCFSAKKGKRILILRDSLCSAIKMKEFNYYIKGGYAYRKSYPGATVKGLAHFFLLTLNEDKPDTCIINIGSNNLSRDQPHEIVADIINVVNIYHT